MKVQVVNHPLLSQKVSILQSELTTNTDFRRTLREVSFHLGYEATRSLTYESPKVKERVALIPILRSGLGMADAFMELLPECEGGVHHIGMYHSSGGENHHGSQPVQYYNRLPKVCNSDIAYVLDPVVYTANTMLSVIGILKKWGVPKIHLVCVTISQSGLQAITEKHPDVSITMTVLDDIDSVLGSNIGDIGDRLFGTPVIESEESLLQSILTKRKRTMSMSEPSPSATPPAAPIN